MEKPQHEHRNKIVQYELIHSIDVEEFSKLVQDALDDGLVIRGRVFVTSFVEPDQRSYNGKFSSRPMYCIEVVRYGKSCQCACESGQT